MRSRNDVSGTTPGIKQTSFIPGLCKSPRPGASFEGAGGPSPPKEKEKKKNERKKKKKRKREKKRRKKKEGNYKLRQITTYKVLFFPIF